MADVDTLPADPGGPDATSTVQEASAPVVDMPADANIETPVVAAKPGSLTKRTGRRAGTSPERSERSERSGSSRTARDWIKYGQTPGHGRQKVTVHPAAKEEAKQVHKWIAERKCATIFQCTSFYILITHADAHKMQENSLQSCF